MQRGAGLGGRIARGLAVATEGHRGDLFGLVVVAFGILAGLGIYADQAGPVGHAISTGCGALFGPLRYLVPPVALGGALLAVRGVAVPAGAPSSDADEVDQPSPTGSAAGLRRAVGATVVWLAGLGLLHLLRGHPRFDATQRELQHAGGLVGATVGVPLRALLGAWGAGVLFAAVGLGGLLLLTGLTVRRAAGATADGVRPAGSALRRGVSSLFRLEPVDDVDGYGSADGVGVDDYADDLDEIDLRGLSDDEPAPSLDEDGLGAAAGEVGEVGGSASVFDQDAHPQSDPPVPAGDLVPTGPGEQLQIKLGPAARRSGWKLPPLKLLERASAQQVDRAAVEETGRTLEHALAEHGVETRLVGMTVGPTVTRFELELGPGVKVARVTSLHKDIAYAMATPDVRILAPIPGRQAIGVEVPNVRKQLVTVGDILSAPEAKKATHPLEVAVGRDIAGKAVLANLATMPHVLIAGATGAGKSSCINCLMTSILMRTTPDQVRMILVDPKRVELGQYNGLPHLLTEVVTNPKKAANALAWAVREMERRYDLLAEVGVRDINGYNAAFDRGDLSPDGDAEPTYARLPYILIVVDELNDLMMVAARDVEESITRIAQMARAVGIHLVIATQRPSVNVITGVIKANIPARWAFAVSSLADSRVILDQPGAEKLLGKGDMLLLGPASSIARRIQGSWVTEDEVRAAVAHWKRQAPEVSYDDTVQGADDAAGSGSGGAFSGGGGDDDDLLDQAMELVVRSQLGSTSMLQRKLRVGFARAGRLMDLLEQRGVVGPSEGSKARSVLMTVDELEGGPSGGGSGGFGVGDDFSDDNLA